MHLPKTVAERTFMWQTEMAFYLFLFQEKRIGVVVLLYLFDLESAIFNLLPSRTIANSHTA